MKFMVKKYKTSQNVHIELNDSDSCFYLIYLFKYI